MLKRIILDTNIYGEMIKEAVEENIKEKLEIHKNDIALYGLSVIRKELRDVPRDKYRGRYNLRMILLSLYDQIIKKELKITPLTGSLAKLYVKNHPSQMGGILLLV